MRKSSRTLSTAMLAAVTFTALFTIVEGVCAQDASFRSLFDGTTLDGWEGSSDLFRIENNAIVGGRLNEQIPANAFLCTVEEFSDFELQLDVKLEGPGDNGGIQFRSRRLSAHHEVSGYQADAGTVGAEWFHSVIGLEPPDSPEARAPVWGSLYDETRRNGYLAWAMPEDVNPILHQGGWNHMTVRAEARRIRIWINGVQTVDYLEQAHIPQSGSICLQIHGGQPAIARHRNIRIKELPGARITFERMKLDGEFFGEGATFGDVNGDDINDIVSGPFWYAGPDFTERFAYYEPRPFDPAGYSDNFFAHVLDFNADGWNDIFIIGFPGQAATWYENPGTPVAVPVRGGVGVPRPGEPQSTPPYWTSHVVFDVVDNESPWWTDLVGDERPEMVFISNGRYGYAAPDWENPEKPWPFHPVTPDGGWQRFTHGLGVGDVNGDGRMDILERAGWWEQPTSVSNNASWQKHPVAFSERGGSQMYTYDVDGDGDNDVITSLAAHDYGLVWYENVGAASATDRLPPSVRQALVQGPGDVVGDIAYVPHHIMGESADENPYGVVFAELHAIDLVDVDGDGLKDIVTGKRWWSHGAEGDPDVNPRAWLYWFQTVRGSEARTAAGDGGRNSPSTSVEFVPHLIDDGSGVGVQIVAGDINADGRVDVIVGNKTGTTLLLQSE